MERVFIYGASGSGKTTFSKDLHLKLGYKLIEADYLREAYAQKLHSKEADPFTYIGTTEAFRQFGDLTQENVLKGLVSVRKSMAPFVTEEIGRYAENLIVEGTFLDPQDLQNQGKLILIITSDEERHRVQYFRHREQSKEKLETFKATRIIQNYFIEEAKNYPVEIIENSFDFEPL